MSTIHAHAPMRIDLAGGTLDIWPIHLALPMPAVTVNVALNMPAEAWVEARPGWPRIVLESLDQGERVEHESLDALLADLAGPTPRLPLLGHAVVAAGLDSGVRVRTRSASPKGAGLGGSSALLVSLVGALGLAHGQQHSAKTLLRTAQDIETRLMRTTTGYQDFHPPFFGGCLALEGAVGGVTTEPIHDLPLDALADRLRLIYTGEPHHSGMTNWGVVRAYLEGRTHAVASLHAIAENSRVVREAVRMGDIEATLRGTVEDGRLRKKMAPRISTPTIKTIHQRVCKAGALGTKILGAGGGGCLLVLLAPGDDTDRVDAVLSEGPGEVLPLKLTTQGLALTRSDETLITPA